MADSVTRRTALGLTAGSLAAVATAGCTRRSEKPPAGAVRHRYGRATDQFGDLYLPSGTVRGTVVLLHGGFWLADYSLGLMDPIGTALAENGWAVWNLEYRRLDAGGDWPATFADTAAGVDHLTALDGVDREHVVLLGHSAGGQLAAWAASRTDMTPGGAPRLDVSGVVSLAGVLDLGSGSRAGLGNGAVDRLMGGTPDEVPDRYRLGDPVQRLPASAPVACLRGTEDDVVPAAQGAAYVAAAKAAGARATLTSVPGDHFTIIDPTQDAWRVTLPVVSSLARR